MQFFRKRLNKKGFTLIELIVVIAILGILAMIAIPRLAGFSENARQANDREQAAIIANAMAMYVASHQADATWTFTIGATGVSIDNLVAADLIETPADLNLESTYYGGDGNNATAEIANGNLAISATGEVSVTLNGAVDYVISK